MAVSQLWLAVFRHISSEIQSLKEYKDSVLHCLRADCTFSSSSMPMSEFSIYYSNLYSCMSNPAGADVSSKDTYSDSFWSSSYCIFSGVSVCYSFYLPCNFSYCMLSGVYVCLSYYFRIMYFLYLSVHQFSKHCLWSLLSSFCCFCICFSLSRHYYTRSFFSRRVRSLSLYSIAIVIVFWQFVLHLIFFCSQGKITCFENFF